MKTFEHSAADCDAAKPDSRKPGRPPADGVTAAAWMQIRTTHARKGHWVRAARPRSLSQWVTEILDRESGYQSPD